MQLEILVLVLMMNKNIKEKINNNNSKSKVKFPDIKSEGLLQINEKSNEKDLKKKPPGFYSKMSDQELIEYADNFCKDNNITKRKKLINYDESLYQLLRKRKLLDSVFGPVKSKPRDFYTKMSKEELIEYAQDFIKENKIKKRIELESKNKGLYHVLSGRELLDSIFGSLESKPPGFYSKMSDQELIKYADNFCEKNEITKRIELVEKNGGLHNALFKSKLLDSVFGLLERKPHGFYSKMSDEELVKYADNFCKDNNITKRKELSIINGRLYHVLRGLKLLDSIFAPLKRKPLGFYTNMSNKELIAYAHDFIKDNNITKRIELIEKNKGLYHVLCRLKLLDSVFPEQSHLDDLVDAIRNFGAGFDDE
jgi:hypothetical protein